MIETGDTMEDTMKRVHQAEVDKAGLVNYQKK
jgi:hypothetical protein